MTAETIINFDRPLYQEKCKEMRDILQLEKEIAAKKKELQKELLKISGGDRMEYGIMIKTVTRKGSVDWKKICETVYDEDTLKRVSEIYRKDDVTYQVVQSY